MTRAVAALALLLLAGCASSIPITPYELQQAKDDVCLHEVAAPSRVALEDAWDELRSQGIAICHWGRSHATAFDGRLCLPEGFEERSTVRQARTLHHELVHYCQRDEYAAFDSRYVLDNDAATFRFIVEVQAKRQEIRAMKTWGYKCGTLRHRIESTPDLLRGAPYFMDILDGLDESVFAVLYLEAPECREP